MKVLFITHYSAFYGANRSLLQLIIELKDHFDIEPFVIVREEGGFVKELESRNIPVLRYRYYNWLNLENSLVKSYIKKILNGLCFRCIKHNLIKNFDAKFDLIHTNSSATNLGGYISKYLKIPHLWQIREYGYLDYNLVYYNGIFKATKFMNENSSAIVVISEDLKNYYSNYIKADKLNVIYNGIKVKSPFEKQRELSKALNLCFIGVICESKNQIEAIKACEYLIKEKRVYNLVLHIVGSGPTKYVNFLKNYVLNNDLQHNIKFIGYLNNVNDFLEKMDVGLVSSKSEAFGRITIEYMMNKMPVIASNTGANPELIENNSEGFLYKYGTPIEMASCIERFIGNNDLIKYMGENAYKKAIHDFSSTKNAAKIFSLYKEILMN